MKNKKKIKIGRSDKIFYTISGIILTLFFLTVLYPVLYVLSASFSSGTAISSGKVYILPVEFTLDGYRAVFGNKDIVLGFLNSLYYTVLGTFINIVITIIAAYAMSRTDVPGTSGFMLFFSFTMFFGGGMIPNYMLMRNLHLLDTRWVMVIPGALSVYNMIVARTFIKNSIPEELLQASQIDGCSDIKYLLKIVLPLSKPIIAVLVLFYAVGHWNSYFNAMLYLNSKKLFSLPLFLKEILVANTIDPSSVSDPELMLALATLSNVLKYALIVVTVVPVLIVYPFVQKYFVKGVMIGSIKG